MSDYKYPRKQGINGPGSPLDGSPNLCELVETALPGISFTIQASGDVCVRTKVELTPQQAADLTAAYEMWEPADLDEYKGDLCAQMAAECDRRIRESPGFEWPIGSGLRYSMSTASQLRWGWLVMYRDTFDYGDPPKVRTKDNMKEYVLGNAAEVFEFGAQAGTLGRTIAQTCDEASGAVMAASDPAAAAAVFKAYMAS